MDTTEKKVFRKSLFGGFSREDVNKYIEEATEKYTAQIKTAEEGLLAASDERDALSEKLRNAEEKLTALTKESEELALLREKHNALISEHDVALLKLSQYESTIERLNGTCAELLDRVETLSSIEGEYTARKAELADIEIAARRRASEIIAGAETEAQETRRSLEEELTCRRKSFDEKKEAAFRETSDSVMGVSRLVDALKAEVESIDSRISRITDSVKNNVTNLIDAVNDTRDRVESIKGRLASDEE